jgi:hypothetical protein
MPALFLSFAATRVAAVHLKPRMRS